MSKEEFENAINSLKDKLDETTQAMVSEELIALIGAFNSLVDEKAEIEEEKAKLEGEKEELLKVNGKLFQKVGFDKEDDEEKVEEIEEEKIDVEDVIDEKGDLV